MPWPVPPSSPPAAIGTSGTQPQRNPLRGVQRTTKQIALFVIAEELHEEARRRVEHQVQADDRTLIIERYNIFKSSLVSFGGAG